MRQTRLVLMAVGGVLLLCVLALIVSLSDYTSHPAVAVAHVPPVVGSPSPDSAMETPSPVPTMPVVSDVPTPTPPPAGPQRIGGEPLTMAQLLQLLQQRRHHRT